MAEESRNAARRPFVVGVLGLKNSGKTTVAEALISGLSARGFRVAAVKTSHLDRLNLDERKRDSRQLYDAGAVCVVAQGRKETLVVQRHDRPAPFSELLRLLAPEAEFVVVEGGVAALADVVLVCLRGMEELEETLRVRRVPPGKVQALTGLAAARPAADRPAADRPAVGGAATAAPPPGNEEPGAVAGLPLLDAAAPQGRETLTRLVLAAAGAEPPPPGVPTSDPRTS